MYKHDDVIHCSFCAQSQNEVRMIICGPGVYICNECIDRCNEIIQEDHPPKDDTGLWPHWIETIDNTRRAYYSMTAIPSKAWRERFYKNWKASTKSMRFKPEVRFDNQTLIVISPRNYAPVYRAALERCVQMTNERR
jgi:ATP-dependent Clp protease ATP-binding subunit ClpX